MHNGCFRISLLAVALAQVGQVQSGTGTITGSVRGGPSQAGIAGVHVAVGNTDAITDSQGWFTLPDIAPGRHWISAYDYEHAGRGGVYALVKAGQELTDARST